MCSSAQKKAVQDCDGPRHVVLGVSHVALGLQHDVAPPPRRQNSPKRSKKSAPRRIGPPPCRVGPPTRRGSASKAPKLPQKEVKRARHVALGPCHVALDLQRDVAPQLQTPSYCDRQR